MAQRDDLDGRAFGRLTVLHRDPANCRYWFCRCECGERTRVQRAALIDGATRSCGCLWREIQMARLTTHGMSKTTEYRTWSEMKKRCDNPTNKRFRHYGGRGIRVCDEWRDNFPAFLAHVGLRPSRQHSIDRIDTNGHYEPGNVRWATRVEQMNNKRTNHRLTFNGETHNLSQWARRCGLRPHALLNRLQRGWPLERALTGPTR